MYGHQRSVSHPQTPYPLPSLLYLVSPKKSLDSNKTHYDFITHVCDSQTTLGVLKCFVFHLDWNVSKKFFSKSPVLWGSALSPTLFFIDWHNVYILFRIDFPHLLLSPLYSLKFLFTSTQTLSFPFSVTCIRDIRSTFGPNVSPYLIVRSMVICLYYLNLFIYLLTDCHRLSVKRMKTLLSNVTGSSMPILIGTQ